MHNWIGLIVTLFLHNQSMNCSHDESKNVLFSYCCLYSRYMKTSKKGKVFPVL